MRILMIAPQPFFQPRGTPFSEFYRIRAMTELGHQVDLLTLFGHLLDVAAEHDGPPEVAALLDAYEARLTAALGPGTAPTHGPVDPALPKAYQDALRRLERRS